MRDPSALAETIFSAGTAPSTPVEVEAAALRGASPDETSGVCGGTGGATYSGRRAEWLVGPVSLGHAAAAAYEGKGIRVEAPCRNSLRGLDCQVAEPARPRN